MNNNYTRSVKTCTVGESAIIVSLPPACLSEPAFLFNIPSTLDAHMRTATNRITLAIAMTGREAAGRWCRISTYALGLLCLLGLSTLSAGERMEGSREGGVPDRRSHSCVLIFTLQTHALMWQAESVATA